MYAGAAPFLRAAERLLIANLRGLLLQSIRRWTEWMSSWQRKMVLSLKKIGLSEREKIILHNIEGSLEIAW